MKFPRTSAVRPPSLRNVLRASLIKAANLESDAGNRKVHAARKELKRARAVLRLMREAMGDPAYRSENARVRDASRPLTLVRDAEVLLHTLDSVSRRDRRLQKRARKIGKRLYRRSVRRFAATLVEEIGDP